MLFSIFFFGGIISLASLPSGVRGEAMDLTSFDRCVPRTNGLVCYSTVDTQDLWNVGASVCQALNMTMLEILTETENKAVFDLLTRKGMVDSWLAAVQSTESWRWLDGVEIGDQGCFVDNVTSPDIEFAEEFPTNNSVANCIAYCKDLLYGYAAVESGYICRCGDTFGKYGQDEANCGIQCPGNLSESCGGPTSQQIYAVNGAAANWLGGQPNNNNGYQSCATLDSSNQLIKWQDVYCKDGNRAVCEIPMVNGLCANSKASVVNGRCLILTDQVASYFESRYNCRSLGGDLVMHLTAADTQDIARWLSRSSGTPPQLYIGLVKWQWKWQTGSEFLYTNWKQDQPTGPHFDCVTIKPDANNGAWTATTCNTPHLYICQQSNATVKVTAPLFTLAPTTTPRRTAPPPLPTTPMAPSSLSTMNHGQQQTTINNPSPPSNSTVNAAIIGGAVAGGVVLLIIICVVVIAFACCGATCCCCPRRGEDAKKKGVESGAETATAPPPPSYFFGIETTPKYRNGDKSSSHPAIPDFDTLKSDSSAFDGNRKSPNPDVVPHAAPGSYPMATPYEDITEARTKPNPYTSDIFVKPELSY